MNSSLISPAPTNGATQRVEFFRLPAPGKRDPHFGLSRGWYYKAAGFGEIKMVALRQRGSLRGVRLVAYDSVADYIRRSMGATAKAVPSVAVAEQLALFAANLPSADKPRA